MQRVLKISLFCLILSAMTGVALGHSFNELYKMVYILDDAPSPNDAILRVQSVDEKPTQTLADLQHIIKEINPMFEGRQTVPVEEIGQAITAHGWSQTIRYPSYNEEDYTYLKKGVLTTQHTKKGKSCVTWVDDPGNSSTDIVNLAWKVDRIKISGSIYDFENNTTKQVIWMNVINL